MYIYIYQKLFIKLNIASNSSFEGLAVMYTIFYTMKIYCIMYFENYISNIMSESMRNFWQGEANVPCQALLLIGETKGLS